MKCTFCTVLSKCLPKLFLMNGLYLKTCLLKLKYLAPAIMVYVFIYVVIYCSPSPISKRLPRYPMHMLKLLTYKYITSMISCPPVDWYQASLITKYNTRMQVQKNYIIHNNNPGNTLKNLTQKMCVNPYIVQFHCDYCLIKQVMTSVSIIG